MRVFPLFYAFLYFCALPVSASVSLDEAVTDAISNDHWISSNYYQEKAIRSDAIAGGQLPDPKLRLGLANLPTDSLRFNQENMTQLQFGLSQQFPRGDSLDIRQHQLSLTADKKPLERIDRKALIKRKVSQIWLALHQVQGQLDLLQKNRHIFRELVSISRANYRNGSSNRVDVLDAELQMTRLKDRISQLGQRNMHLQSSLAEWLGQPFSGKVLPSALPEIMLLLPLVDMKNEQLLNRSVLMHPLLLQMDQNIAIREQGVSLAEEAYKPGFKVDANYGYRDDMSSGKERADFFSVAVTLDLPIFPEKRQDARRNSAINQREAIKEQRLLQARKLMAELKSELANLDGINDRIDIFNKGFLRQLSAKRLAALDAYSTSNGRFSEVSAAAMGELESKLQKIALVHERSATMVRINYVLSGNDPQLNTFNVLDARESK